MSTQMLNDRTFEAGNVAKVKASPASMTYGGVIAKTLVLLVLTVIAALALAAFTTGYVAKPFRIPSESMQNTLRCSPCQAVGARSVNRFSSVLPSDARSTRANWRQ